MESIQEEKVGKYTVKVFPDESPFDPRENDNLTQMVCFHGRYSLGDKHEYSSDDYSGWDEMEQAIIKQEKVAVIKPLFMYDHSGITIATTPFSCPWDSGQIGFVFITKKKLREEYGYKKMTPKAIEKAEKMIDAEVEEYDKYVRGEAYL